jgi:hypothetical protein
MNEAGWIKIPRSIWQNPRVKMEGWLSVWIWMLCRAAHNGIEVFWKGQRQHLDPGQFTASRLEISLQTGVSQSQVYRIVSALKKEQQIEQQSSNIYSLYTIIDIDKYIFIEQPVKQPINDEIAAKVQPTSSQVKSDPIKEAGNIQNATTKTEDDPFGFCSSQSILRHDDFLKAWSEWSNYRKEKGKPLTPLAVKEQIEYLESQADCNTAIKIIKLTMRNGWTKF